MRETQRERKREAQTQAEGEAGSMQGAPPSSFKSNLEGKKHTCKHFDQRSVRGEAWVAQWLSVCFWLRA